MKKVTVEDHLTNILYGLRKANLTWDEQENVRISFLAIKDMLIPKEVKEVKDKEVILP